MNLAYDVPYYNKSIDQCRSIGRRGGRRSARTRRLRQASQPPAAQVGIHLETAHEANMLLDAQFPWLAGCERRTPSHPQA